MNSSYVAVRMLMSQDRMRNVEFFQRRDGTFPFQEWVFDVEDKAWRPRGYRTHPFIDTLDHAISEAAVRVSWLKAEG